MIQPRVARIGLPWVTIQKEQQNPEGVESVEPLQPPSRRYFCLANARMVSTSYVNIASVSPG